MSCFASEMQAEKIYGLIFLFKCLGRTVSKLCQVGFLPQNLKAFGSPFEFSAFSAFSVFSVWFLYFIPLTSFDYFSFWGFGAFAIALLFCSMKQMSGSFGNELIFPCFCWRNEHPKSKRMKIFGLKTFSPHPRGGSARQTPVQPLRQFRCCLETFCSSVLWLIYCTFFLEVNSRIQVKFRSLQFFPFLKRKSRILWNFHCEASELGIFFAQQVRPKKSVR